MAGIIGHLRAVSGRAARDLRDRLHARRAAWHPVPGTDMQLRGGTWLAAGAEHEEAEIALYRAALARCDAVIDVGANSGLYSLIAAAAGKPCFAFEPLRDNLAVLYENLAANGADGLVEVFPMAASDRVGIARFFGRGQGASLLPGWAGQPDYDFEWVATNTLDNVLAARLQGRRVFLKLDVEGAETQVIQGAGRILTLADTVLLEHSLTRNQPGGLHSDFLALFEIMWAAGFEAFVADAAGSPVDRDRVEGWIAARRTDSGTENLIFRKPDCAGG